MDLSRTSSDNSNLFHLYMYAVKCEHAAGSSQHPPFTHVSEFAILFGTELDSEVLSMPTELFVTKASVIFIGHIQITEAQLTLIKSFHVTLMSIVLDVEMDVHPSNAPLGVSKAYLFAPLAGGISADPMNDIVWFLVENVTKSDASSNSPQRARLAPSQVDLTKGKLVMADSLMEVQDLVGDIVTVTASYSGKRYYVDSVTSETTAESSFPRKEYTSYVDYYKQKHGIDLMYKQQPLIRARGISYCKSLLSSRREQIEGREKIHFVFLPPELCYVHPLPGSLVNDAQRLPSIMWRIESMLVAVKLKDVINHPVAATKILEALTVASCEETFCYERAELLGDAYLKWVVSTDLFLKHPQKDKAQLTSMREQMLSNTRLSQHAWDKGLQSYIQADRFAPSRWAAPGVLSVFDEITKQEESSCSKSDTGLHRVLSSKQLADVVEALIGVCYVEGGENAANHFMKWIGIDIDFDLKEQSYLMKQNSASEKIPNTVDFDALESALNVKFNDKSFLVKAITHASHPSSGVYYYKQLEFLGDAVLDYLITKHLFFKYTDLPPGRLSDIRAASVSMRILHALLLKINFMYTFVKNQVLLKKMYLFREFVKEVQNELSEPGFNSFSLGDCIAPKVLGDIVGSIAGAIFLDTGCNAEAVWKVFQTLLDPMVTPETLHVHPVRELQERCQQQDEDQEYIPTRNGDLATVKVYVGGVCIGVAHSHRTKMAKKLAARNALVTLRERDEAKQHEEDNAKEKNESHTFPRRTLHNLCSHRKWPMPVYNCVDESGPSNAKRYKFGVRVETAEGWTPEFVGKPKSTVKKAKEDAAVLLLEF